MKFGAICAAVILLFSALALALPDNADAARMGGGRSFGSRPSMSQPAPAPRQSMQRSAVPGNAATAANAASRPALGGMGGMLGGLLAGTLLGSLLGGGSGAAGGASAGGSFLDLIFLGLLAFLAYKLFKKFRSGSAPQPAGAGNNFPGRNPFNNDSNMARNDVGTGWNGLGGAQESATQNIDVPAGFDVDEFLKGAKMAYNRMQKSWDRRDLNDIANFATPAVMDVLREQMANDPNPSNTEIMLVNARLLGVEKEGADERAQVFFDVLMRETPNQQTPTQAREIWHFWREGTNGNWKLDGIQQVE